MTASSFNPEAQHLMVHDVHHYLPPSALYEHTIRYEHDSTRAGLFRANFTQYESGVSAEIKEAGPS